MKCKYCDKEDTKEDLQLFVIVGSHGGEEFFSWSCCEQDVLSSDLEDVWYIFPIKNNIKNHFIETKNLVMNARMLSKEREISFKIETLHKQIQELENERREIGRGKV